MPNCKFCGQEIMWVKEGRRNRPIDMEGNLHSCEQMQSSMKSIKTMDRNSLSPEEIAKYEQAMNDKNKK